MAAQPEHVAFLRSTSMFSTVPDATLEKVAEMASEKQHALGKTIVRQSGQAHAFHLIVDGEVDVVADGVTLARLGPGDHFGEIAIVDDAKRNATVTAVTPVSVLAIDTISFRRLVGTDASLATALPPAIAERLSNRDHKLNE